MNVFDILEKFLKKHKISGIFFIPGYGSATIFKNEIDKLVVLNHSQLELDVEKEKHGNEVFNRVRIEVKGKNKFNCPSYIK